MSEAFDLLVECCRHSFAGDGQPRIDQMAATADWSLVLRLCRRHRVEALVWDALIGTDSVPADAAAALRADAIATTDHNLRSAAECARLAEAFGDRDIPLLFLKGLTLAALAYPTPFLKMGWDIDILVAPDRVEESAALLHALGYTAVLPETDRFDRIVQWHRSRKESIWHTAERSFYVELHSRLADNSRLLPDVGVHAPRQIVRVAPGLELPTLADGELFAYLTVHGASSAWFRVKWIADLAAFLHRSSVPIAELISLSQQLGAGRAPAQALILADRLFRSLEGTDLRSQLESDARSRWLADSAYGALNGRRASTEPTARPFGTVAIHLTQFALMPGLPFKLSESLRQARYLFP